MASSMMVLCPNPQSAIVLDAAKYSIPVEEARMEDKVMDKTASISATIKMVLHIVFENRNEL